LLGLASNSSRSPKKLDYRQKSPCLASSNIFICYYWLNVI
jgi:hypothetical protein